MISTLHNKVDIFVTEIRMALELCRNNNWICKGESCAVTRNLSIKELVVSLKESAIPLDQLIFQIVETHLNSIKYTLPRFSELFMREQLSNIDSAAAIARVESLFAEFNRTLKMHMVAEEAMLFPYILTMEEAAKEDRNIPLASFVSLNGFLDQLIAEHKTLSITIDQIREALNEIQATTDNKSSINLNNVLATLEREMQTHIHLEENFIFPIAQHLVNG